MYLQSRSFLTPLLLYLALLEGEWNGVHEEITYKTTNGDKWNIGERVVFFNPAACGWC